jgi:hypothetical protein
MDLESLTRTKVGRSISDNLSNLAFIQKRYDRRNIFLLCKNKFDEVSKKIQNFSSNNEISTIFKSEDSFMTCTCDVG